MKIIKWISDLDTDSEVTMPPKVQQVPVRTPEFNWDSPNLHEAFKLFKDQVTYLLIKGPWKHLEDDGKIGAFLNWLGPKSYAVFNNLVFGTGKSNEKFEDVLEAFELYFKPTQSIYQSWYLLGSFYSGACESQAAFMNKLNEIAGECGFTTKDEVVKLLFLIHNQDARVRDKLLKNLTPTSSLQECLGWAKCVESTIQTEALSEKLLKGMGLSESKRETKVDAIRNKLKWKKFARKAKVIKSDTDSDSEDEFKSCKICGLQHPPNRCPAYGEVCFKCGKKNHFSRMCGKYAKKGYTRFTKKSVAELELTDDDTFEYD